MGAKSDLNRRRERELIDAGGYRLPGGTLPPAYGRALRRIMARGADASKMAAIGRGLLLLDQLQTMAERRNTKRVRVAAS
jgi:hypothetical protein